MSLKNYTYSDYCNLNDDRRYEIINGVIYAMRPAPSPNHQDILMAIATSIFIHVHKSSCKVYVAPFDVRLPLKGEDDAHTQNVVQPDIVVLCDKSKIDARGCVGAPDLVIEIISPSTARIDLVVKKALYEAAGVREYWIIDPFTAKVSVFRLEGDCFGAESLLSKEEMLTSSVLPELTIDLAEVFSAE